MTTRLYRDGLLELDAVPAADISDHLKDERTVVWIDLVDPDQAVLDLIAEELSLHALALEDAIMVHERPKGSTGTASISSSTRCTSAWTRSAGSCPPPRCRPSSPAGRW